MHQELLDYIVCPHCKHELILDIFREINSEILDGVFRCKVCTSSYFIIEGIPRVLPISFLVGTDFFNKYLTKYKKELSSIKQINIMHEHNKAERDKLAQLKRNTFKYFGFEWDFFEDWGWHKEKNIPEIKRIEYYGGLISDSERAFESKSLMNDDDLKEGKLVLDAGCGNGRYTNQASQQGAICIGIDIAWGAVKSAYRKLKRKKNVHIIQGDLFNLPFKNNLFNSVFSIGVLMHTGDAKKAFLSISKNIKQGGVFTVRMYHKRNFIFEINDFLLRSITTKLSIKNVLRFSRFLATIGKILAKKNWQKKFKILQFIQILPTIHHMFDWYSAPIATHHTYQEVKNWFREAGFKIIKSKEPKGHSVIIRPEFLTLKGLKR